MIKIVKNKKIKNLVSIKKKFLFWWIDCYILSVDIVTRGWGSADCTLARFKYDFSEKSKDVHTVFEELSNPFVEYYKGKKIIKVWYAEKSKFVYVNVTDFYKRHQSSNKEYHVSVDLNFLKFKIDL